MTTLEYRYDEYAEPGDKMRAQTQAFAAALHEAYPGQRFTDIPEQEETRPLYLVQPVPVKHVEPGHKPLEFRVAAVSEEPAPPNGEDVDALRTRIRELEIELEARKFSDSQLPAGTRSLKKIFAEVCRKYDLEPHLIAGQRRFKKLVLARQEFSWRASKETGKSLPTIGRFLGGRDHTTILHGIRQHQARLDRGEVR